jgi:hypothetical protein
MLRKKQRRLAGRRHGSTGNAVTVKSQRAQCITEFVLLKKLYGAREHDRR